MRLSVFASNKSTFPTAKSRRDNISVEMYFNTSQKKFVKICAIRGKKKEQSNKTPNQLKSVQSVAKKNRKAIKHKKTLHNKNTLTIHFETIKTKQKIIIRKIIKNVKKS